MMKEADLVIAIGAGLNAWTTGFGENLRGAKLIHLDQSPGALGLHTAVDLALVGTSRCSLLAMLDLLPIETRSSWWTAAHEPQPNYRDGEEGEPDPLRVLDAIDAVLPDNRIIIADGGHCVQAVCQRMMVSSPKNWTYSFDFGCIGQGLGLAIGACFARPGERVTLITGDASLLMNIGDLDTIMRYNLPLTIIVLNDNGFGQERHALEAKGLSPEHAVLKAPDFALMARAVGGRSRRCEHVSELDGSISELASLSLDTGLHLLDIGINKAVKLEVSAEIANHLLGG